MEGLVILGASLQIDGMAAARTWSNGHDRAEERRAVAVVVIGRLSLTLIVIPIAYASLDTLRERMRTS